MGIDGGLVRPRQTWTKRFATPYMAVVPRRLLCFRVREEEDKWAGKVADKGVYRSNVALAHAYM